MAIAPPTPQPIPMQALAAPAPAQRQPRSQRESAAQTVRAARQSDRTPKGRDRDRNQERGGLMDLST